MEVENYKILIVLSLVFFVCAPYLVLREIYLYKFLDMVIEKVMLSVLLLERHMVL